MSINGKVVFAEPGEIEKVERFTNSPIYLKKDKFGHIIAVDDQGRPLAGVTSTTVINLINDVCRLTIELMPQGWYGEDDQIPNGEFVVKYDNNLEVPEPPPTADISSKK